MDELKPQPLICTLLSENISNGSISFAVFIINNRPQITAAEVFDLVSCILLLSALGNLKVTVSHLWTGSRRTTRFGTKGPAHP